MSWFRCAYVSLAADPSGPGSPAASCWRSRSAASRATSARAHSASSRWCSSGCGARGAGARPPRRSRSCPLPWAPRGSCRSRPARSSAWRWRPSSRRRRSPIRLASGTRTSVRNTSLNSASPVIWRSGRTSTPGSVMSQREVGEPGVLGHVRVGAGHAAAPTWPGAPRDVHTFCPVTTQSSPSRTARVASEARSLPAPGSLNSWHQTSSQVHSGRSQRCCCSCDAQAMIVGAAMPRPMTLSRGRCRGRQPR